MLRLVPIVALSAFTCTLCATSCVRDLKCPPTAKCSPATPWFSPDGSGSFAGTGIKTKRGHQFLSS
jgi:hypothetical protein